MGCPFLTVLLNGSLNGALNGSLIGTGRRRQTGVAGAVLYVWAPGAEMVWIEVELRWVG